MEDWAWLLFIFLTAGGYIAFKQVRLMHEQRLAAELISKAADLVVELCAIQTQVCKKTRHIPKNSRMN